MILGGTLLSSKIGLGGTPAVENNNILNNVCLTKLFSTQKALFGAVVAALDRPREGFKTA